MDFHQIAEREVGSAFQDLIHKLKEAADAELRDVRRELENDLDTIRRQADTLRDELETESARAATLEADLDSVIEAHRTVDGERLKAEQEVGVLTGRLDAARAELARLQESLESEAALRALLDADVSSTREALAAAEATIRTLEGNIRTLESSVASLQAELQQVHAAADAQLTELRASADATLQELRAAADTEARDARAAADTQVQQLRAAAEQQLHDARADADARLREAMALVEARGRELDELRATTDAQLREARAQAEATVRDVQEQAHAELRQARDRADTEIRQARESSDQALEELRVEVEAQVEAVRAEAAAEMTEVRAQAAAELRDARTQAAEQLREAQEAAQANDSRVAELTVRLASSRDELAAAREELTAAQARTAAQGTDVAGRDDTIAALQAQLADARETERTLRASADEAREISLRLRDDGQAQAARIAEAIARAETAETATRLAEDELATLRARPETGAALLQASVRALEALAAATSVADLMAALSRQLAPHFGRVAIFRVKGHRLEGEQAAGLERGTDITGLSIPLNAESCLARAARTHTLQDLDLLALADDPAPLGGSPSAAIAVPVVFQGETFAVAYVDSADEIEPAPRALAALLTAQASVLLGRLSQEMKLMKELRDYAALLVQEAEQMFVADLESGRGEADRRRRLAETIDCARQLFAQRAALDGPAAARALDDYLLEVMTAPNDAPFAADLAAILTSTAGARKTG